MASFYNDYPRISETNVVCVVHRILLQNSYISSSIPIRLLYFHSWSPIFPIYFWAKNGWEVCNYISIILKTRLDVSTAACHPKSLQTTHATLLESQLDAGCNIVASKTMLDEMFIRQKKTLADIHPTKMLVTRSTLFAKNVGTSGRGIILHFHPLLFNLFDIFQSPTSVLLL